MQLIRPSTQKDIEAACAGYFEEAWLAWELSDVRPVQYDKKVRAARRIYEVDFMKQTCKDGNVPRESRHDDFPLLPVSRKLSRPATRRR